MNLSERDRQSVWHPFTQHMLAPDAISIVRGEGALLFDENGKEYIDAVSSWWTNLFGHGNPIIKERIKKQLDALEHVIFAGFTHAPAVEAAEKLLNMLPGNPARVFFSDNGSTAVEVALKMAIQYWHNNGGNRKTVIAFRNAYHGDTFGAMSVGERGVFNKPFQPLLFDVEFIDLPRKENRDEVYAAFMLLLKEKNVAAFIFEPLIQGSGGMIMYEAAYLEELVQVAKDQDVICIADEVMTGFGRTGKNFACNYLQNQADIFCLSKGITGGFLPLGATACTQRIYDAFLSSDKLKTFFHGHSYTANPLACAAASASMDVLGSFSIQLQKLVDLQTALSASIQKHKKIENFRQLGTIVAFEVKSPSGGYLSELRELLYNGFVERGVLLRPLGNTVYIMPPYVISREQLQKVYSVIRKVLDSL